MTAMPTTENYRHLNEAAARICAQIKQGVEDPGYRVAVIGAHVLNGDHDLAVAFIAAVEAESAGVTA